MPSSHSAGSALEANIVAWHHNVLAAEITAIETALGTNLSNIAGNGEGRLISTNFVFPRQNPAGALTANIINTVTLAPVPVGINGTDVNHYLYVYDEDTWPPSGEAVLIQGGTAVSGAASGTILFTPTANHPAGWTLISATNGIQEAIVSALPSQQFDLYIPAGNHQILGMIYLPETAIARINGAGMYITILYAHPPAGPTVQLDGNSQSALDFGHLTISRSGIGLGTSDIGLYLNNWSPQAMIHDLTISLAYDGIAVNGQPSFTHVFVSDFQHIGMHGIGDRVGGTWNDILVGNGIHSGEGSDAPYAVKIDTTVDGIYCENSSFGGADYAFYVMPASSTFQVFAANLYFVNCIFERYNLNGYVQQSDADDLGGGLAFLSNCRFISRNKAGTTPTGLSFITVGGTIKLGSIHITNCYIGCNVIGIRLAGVANAMITGNAIYGMNLSGFGDSTGIVIENTTGGTANKNITITGNELGYEQMGGEADTDADFHGGPLEIPIQIFPNAGSQIAITGNVLFGRNGNPVRIDTPPADLVLRDNTGIENISYQTIASAPTIDFQAGPQFRAYPFLALSGNAAVTAVAGLWEGAKGVMIPNHVSPGVWTAGATIGNTFTPQTNVPVYWEFRAGKIWLK
jgi:hypothetical protein